MCSSFSEDLWIATNHTKPQKGKNKDKDKNKGQNNKKKRKDILCLCIHSRQDKKNNHRDRQLNKIRCASLIQNDKSNITI